MLTSNLAAKGMNTDILEKFQEEGTYRFALNAVLETQDGDIRGISNEEGTTQNVINFPTGKKIIGHTLTDTNDIVLFLFDPTTDRPSHEIGLYNPLSKAYSTIGKGECLNFTAEHQINAIFRLKDGCTKYVYFTDGVNPYRVVNITDTTDWVNQSTKVIISCDKIRYSRPYKVPKIEGYTGEDYVDGLSDSGGQLLYGNYSFAVRLVDYDGNPTDWMTFTRYFPVFYSSLNNNKSYSTYNKVVGASNVESEIGYKAPSSKSIKLVVDNLDTKFSKFQIAVIKRTATSGEVTGVDILEPQQIFNPSSLNSVTSTFIFTGASSQVNTESSIDELFSEKVVLDRVVAHTQADSRLLVANVSTTPRNYSSYQRHASSIKTEWTKSPVLLPNPSSKSSYGYQKFSGFQDDEVYAFGIVYIHSDGTHSPAFHIPGRPMDIVTAAASANAYINDANPLDSHTVSPSDPNLVDLNLDKRWQVYNTYTLSGTRTGYMGYYQSNSTYPKITLSCDSHADGYWGRDFTGALIDHTKPIRHHRMPLPQSRVLPTTFDYEVCGVKFTMTNEYPSSDIVGHYYVSGDRSNGDKTVLDAGVYDPIPGRGNDTYGYLMNMGLFVPYVSGFAAGFTSGIFLSNQVQYQSKLQEGAYVRVLSEMLYNNGYTYNYLTSGTANRFTRNINLDTLTYVAGTNIQTYPVNNPIDFNYKITDSEFLPKNDKYLEVDSSGWENTTGSSAHTVTGANVKNISNSVNMGAVTLNRSIADTESAAKICHILIKVYNDVFSNLFNINYKKLHNSHVTKSSGSTLVTSLYSGDILVSTSEFADNEMVDNGTDIFVTHISRTFLIPGEINASGKMYGIEGKDDTYRGNFNVVNTSAKSLLNYLVNDKMYKEGDVIGYYPEPHRISMAYSHYMPDKIYLPLPPDHDFCASCNDEDYPYRIYYSEQDTQESKRDFFRLIRPNNYKDLDGYIGRITDLFTFKENLYALTSNSCVFLPFRPQSIETNEGAFYLGTGEFLSLPARQLKTTEYAFGGTSHFKSRVLTEYGALYIDDKSARPFLLSEGLNDISLTGMRSFFQENGRLELVKQFESKGIIFPHYSTSSPIGVGYITTYEPRYKRAIIHKRDFKILDAYAANFVQGTNVTTPNTLWWDGSRFVYNNDLGIVSYPTLSDNTFFENKSFTISYSFLTNSFVSFHSYLPQYMFNNFRNFFSDNIHVHEGEYQNYYGYKRDFIVDYINTLSPKEIKTFSYATIRNRSYLDGFKNTTFDRAIAYNTHQTTGVISLDKDKTFDLSYPVTNSSIKTNDGTYRINGLRDNTISNSSPLWSSAWQYTQGDYFIDRVPNPNNINYNQSLFTQQRLKDYFLGLRLFYKPLTNEKIVVDILDVEYSSRNR